MYIGPWQEYRLAKIQDDAIQRIRQEWEDNIRAQLPDSDDNRIRELMQPLMAKLPALLMAKKSADRGDSTTTPGSRKARRPPLSSASSQSRQSTRPSTAISTASSTRSRIERTVSAASVQASSEQNNQETHDKQAVASASSQPPKPMSRTASSKKKKKSGSSSAPLNALEQVEKRKKLFAKWMKQEQTPSDSRTPGAPGVQADQTRLPPIYPEGHAPNELTRPQDGVTHPTEVTHLPPLIKSELEAPESPSPPEEPNLDDSLDEDEVNQLLNWTDNLLSPNALDASLAGMDEELDEME